jgi:hypothetical protein
MKDERYLEFQATLEKESAELASVKGYDRLISTIKGVASWDEYMEIRAQINITKWFKEKSLLKEIEPGLPQRKGNTDALLSFSEQDIYCEVTSPQSLQKSIESRKQSEANKVQNLLKTQPWMSKLDAEHKIKQDRITRILLGKTNKQLPRNYPGILALETGKSMVFTFDTKEIAQTLLPTRPQVILIMLWSLEREGAIGQPPLEAPFWFLNRNSHFRDTGRRLLKHLKQEHKITECG